MSIGIRADWCIALRMIALHEFRRRQWELVNQVFSDDEMRRIVSFVNRIISERKKDEGNE
jgi:hypothetical protein